MVRLQNVLGLPVIDGGNGRIVGHVRDVSFDEHWRPTGIVLHASRWWFRTVCLIVPWSGVRACGDDAVVIADRSAAGKADDELGRTFRTGPFRLKDLPVVTEDGRQLGRIIDVYFEPDMGTPILGYELTDGFVSDLMEGRKWLRMSAIADGVTLGEDVIFVPAHCGDLLETVVTS